MACGRIGGKAAWDRRGGRGTRVSGTDVHWDVRWAYGQPHGHVDGLYGLAPLAGEVAARNEPDF